MTESATQTANGQCLLVCAVKGDESEERANAEFLEKYVLKPVLEQDPFNLKVERHDETDEPGSITSNLIDRLINDELVVVDLSYENVNVGYEMGIRHAFQKPSILMVPAGSARAGSDVTHPKYVKYDRNDVVINDLAKERLTNAVTSIRSGDYDDRFNPVNEAAALQSIKSNEERVLLRTIIERLEAIESNFARTTNSTNPSIPNQSPRTWVQSAAMTTNLPLINGLSEEERNHYLRIQFPLAPQIAAINDSIFKIADSYTQALPKLSAFDQSTVMESAQKALRPLIAEYESLSMLGLPPTIVDRMRASITSPVKEE